MIIILGRVEVDPSRVPALRPAMQAMMRATFEESGCLSYSLALEHDGADGAPAVITIAERWADEAAIRAHMDSPHMVEFNRIIDGAVLSADARMYDGANERPFGL